MSRIYDALQRADQERKTGSAPDAAATTEPLFVSGVEQPLAAKVDTLLDDIVQHSWKPSLVSLPTIGERGECIEQFRSLRSHLYQLCNQAPLKTILVSSGEPGEGKSFIAANLAVSLARNNSSRVLLIDGDLRCPSLHTLLGAPRTPGLAEYLAGDVDAVKVLQRNQSSQKTGHTREKGISNLTFIASGKGGDNSSELIANHRFEELIASLAPHFDWIVIDSPPALAFADAIDLARGADGVLLVARAAMTHFDVAQRAQAAFVNSRLLGFALNDVKNARSNGYYYYYGRHSAEHGLSRKKDKRRQE